MNGVERLMPRPPKGQVRPMRPTDLPKVGQLFLKVFRGRSDETHEGFAPYLEEVLFGSPSYGEDVGSIVHESADGVVGSAILVVPMEFIVGERRLTGRMMCAFMVDADAGPAGPAELTLSIRMRRQDLCFTDTASPTSRGHLVAIGSRTLALQALEWRRTLRPLGLLARRLERRLGRTVPVLPALALSMDGLLRRFVRRWQAPAMSSLSIADMPDDDFYALAPKFVAHYRLRPAWSRPELQWLVKMARDNTMHGPLRIRSVGDAAGRTIGCYVCYGASGREAEVLNVLALPNRESDVVEAMLRDLDDAGCVAASGRAQRCLMSGLALQKALVFRHKAFVMVGSRHADVTDAIERDDIYLGGLAGESWSRLMSDFL